MRRNLMGSIFFLVLVLILWSVLGYLFGWPQEKSKLVGDWQMVVEAEGQYFYLHLSLKEVEGKLEGIVSEASGFFKDIPLTNLKLEADHFTFDFTSPTPPDGLARLVSVDLKISPDYEKMEGSLYVPDLGIGARATVSRKT